MSPLDRPHSIIVRYIAGERSFVSEELDDQVHDFAGAKLEGADFSGCFVLGDFRGANLQGVCFKNSNVKTCDFTGANLRDASFQGAAIDGAVFDDAVLVGASFEGASEQGHIYRANESPC